MKLPRVAQLVERWRNKPEAVSEPEAVGGMHAPITKGEQGSNPAPGTVFTRFAAAFRGGKPRSAYRSAEEQQELELERKAQQHHTRVAQIGRAPSGYPDSTRRRTPRGLEPGGQDEGGGR